MAKLFATNILRSILITAIAILVAGCVNLGVNYLSIRFFKVTSAPIWLFGGIAVVLPGFMIGLVNKWGEEGGAVFPDVMQEKDSKWLKLIENGKKIKWSQIKLSLLPHLLVGISMVAVVVYRLSHWLDLTDNPPANPLLNGGLYAVTAVMAAMVTQFGYYFAFRSRYRDTRCDKCGHVLCLVYAGVDSVSEFQKVEQQESNESRYVEWEMNGTVYGGRTEGSRSSRIVTTEATHFNCRCVICGNEQLHTEKTGEKASKWSEWH